MEDFKEKLQALEEKVDAYCKAHGYVVKRDDVNDVRAELHEVAELLRDMKPEPMSKTDERFARKKRRNEPKAWY